MKNIFLAALLFFANASASQTEILAAANYLKTGDFPRAKNVLQELQKKEDALCLHDAVKKMMYDPISTYSLCLTDQNFSSLILLAASLNRWKAMGNLMFGLNTHYTPQYAKESLNLNLQDEYGNTALHYAAKAGKGGTALLLLKYGASNMIFNNDEQTAFDIADKSKLNVDVRAALERSHQP